MRENSVFPPSFRTITPPTNPQNYSPSSSHNPNHNHNHNHNHSPAERLDNICDNIAHH